MYIVTIENNGVETQIHNLREKLTSGNVVKGINTIDSFSFTILPSNPAFDMLHEFTTLVKVYNVNRDRYEFYGRVLYANPSMSEEGMIKKEVTCESYFAFLCDSQQKYVVERNWTVRELLQHIIDTHNSKVEAYKQFKIGEVTVSDPNDNLYIGIKRENTWETLQDKLLDKLGGELRFRVEEDGLYLDYLVEIGEEKQTPIKLSHNMKSIEKEHDPTQYITRLIPLGCKLENSDNSEDRLDITSVNDGVEYIDDVEAIAEFGLHEGYHEWDNVTEPENLKRKAEEWLASNNRVLVKYRVTALDLSQIGLDMDDFDVYNKHPVENDLIGIYDVARIIKKGIDICNDTRSEIDVGDNFKNLSDLEIEKQKEIKSVSNSVSNLERSTTQRLNTIEKSEASLRVEVEDVKAGFDSKVNVTALEEYKEAVAKMYASIDTVLGIEADVTTKVSLDEFNDYKSAAAEMYVTLDGVDAKIGVYAVNSDGTTKTFAQILADQIALDAELTTVRNLAASKITADDITADIVQSKISDMSTLYVDNALSVSGSSYLQNASTAALSVGGDFRLNAELVSKTSLTLVTDFTQALTTSGGVAQTGAIKLLTVRTVGSASAQQVAAGEKITLN